MRLSTRQKSILDFCEGKERKLSDILKMLGKAMHSNSPRYYLSRTLGRLVSRGELVRVKRGVFKKPSWRK